MMNILEHKIEEVCDELREAEHYAEEYVCAKAANDSTKASNRKQMSNDEIKHADVLYAEVKTFCESIKSVYMDNDCSGSMDDLDHMFSSITTKVKTMLSV